MTELNPFSYQGKRVVVTGAASGVGAALVELLAELGATHITAIDRNRPAAAVHQYIEADLSSAAGVRAAAGAVEGPVHSLFVNAGVAGTQPARIVLSVNYLSARLLTELLTPRMPAGSAVTVTASTAGGGWPAHRDELLELMGVDDWDKALAWLEARPALIGDPYALSKEAVQFYTMFAARSLAQAGLRINSACPGPITTPLLADFKATMTEKVLDWAVSQGNGRPATPAEVAHILAFLGSEASAYLSGVNITVDGGMTAALNTGQADLSALTG
ncbi:coniferyl-alcohol dehydrogenase [Frankia sp. AgKG'84/4]|uniref:coniferyl-alcohol dehydrogenase n=1 Tax=Frankia sp. AgKG'84/4 TaxID=573490 RepID=UPI00200EA81D|nr:coniferyl-alcohol dehydrogenase [Frankia sp. AgKG'84/4]MCL9795855.1 coniferyl-alcohol dehydrogenase [Frankia sp. AgKG'84/4]